MKEMSIVPQSRVSKKNFETPHFFVAFSHNYMLLYNKIGLMTTDFRRIDDFFFFRFVFSVASDLFYGGFFMNYLQVKDSLKELLKIDSVEAPAAEGKPFGKGAYEALDYMLRLGESMGFAVKNVDGYAGHIEWGEGELFGILCHLDVVPAGSDWTYPPFGAVEADGYLYARGTQDDKSPAMAVLYAMKTLKDEGFVPKKKIRLILGCNEESGWKCIEHYFAVEEMPVMGFSPDADFPVINCEKGVLHMTVSFPTERTDRFELISLSGGERVNMVADHAACEFVSEEEYAAFDIENGHYKLSEQGISSHGSTPAQGVNALHKLFEKLAAVTADPSIHQIYDRFCRSTDGSDLGLKLSDERSGALTVNFGKCELKEGRLYCEIDIRYPVSYEKELILDKLREALPLGTQEEVHAQRPLYVEKNHPLVQKLLAAYRRVTGDQGEPIAIGGATYSRALECCVAFGPVFPGSESTIHQRNERISLEELEKLCDIYYLAIKSIAE